MLGPGDLVNYVTSRPYEVTFWEPYEVVVVTVPLAALGSHTDTLAGRTAIAVGTDRGPRDVVGTLLDALAAKIDGCTPGDASSSKEYLADAIVSLVIAELVDIVPQGAGDDLADRVLAHCLSHLPDPGLTVESVGRALGVSVRYLHKVLAPTGMHAVGLDPPAAAGTDRPRPRRRVAARAHRGRDRRTLGDARHRAPEPRPEGRVRHDRERDPPVGPLGTRRTPPAAGAAAPRRDRAHLPPGHRLTGRHRQVLRQHIHRTSVHCVQTGEPMTTSAQKVAIVTGASRGIGAGVVEGYRKHGYSVVATSRSITQVRRPAGAHRRGDLADPQPRRVWSTPPWSASAASTPWSTTRGCSSPSRSPLHRRGLRGDGGAEPRRLLRHHPPRGRDDARAGLGTRRHHHDVVRRPPAECGAVGPRLADQGWPRRRDAVARHRVRRQRACG